MLIIGIQQLYFQIKGSNVECNICHCKADKFKSNTWHKYCDCPRCRSGVRQRLIMASLSNLDKFGFDKIIKNKKVLHFAPEKSLGKVISGKAREYKTADLLAGGYSYHKIDFNMDISDMKNIKNETFDCVIACDVLEHVPDHQKGMQEIHRVLKKDGYCILTVPQKDNLEITFEDSTVVDKKEREKIFGQWDHLRIYGDDFKDILQNNGFEVTAVNETFFEQDIVDHYVLFPPVLSENPLATNYRKIFFGRKR